MLRSDLHLIYDNDGTLRLGQSLHSSYILRGEPRLVVECLLAISECGNWSELKTKFNDQTMPTITMIRNFMSDHQNLPIWTEKRQTDRKELYINKIGAVTDFKAGISDTVITIIGVGGVGSSVALQLAKLGFEQFFLIDEDLVEEVNLFKCLAYDKDSIGCYKVFSLEKKLKEINSKIKIGSFNCRFQEVEGLDKLIDVTKKNIIAQCGDKEVSDILEKIKKDFGDADFAILSAGCVEDFVVCGPSLCSSDLESFLGVWKKRNEDGLTESIHSFNERVLNIGITSSVLMAASLIVNEVMNFVFSGSLSLSGRQIRVHLPTSTIENVYLENL